jgi:hypothetical protein
MGATMCQLFVEIGDDNAEVFDESNARFVGKYTTNPMPVFFDEGDRGKIASYSTAAGRMSITASVA